MRQEDLGNVHAKKRYFRTSDRVLSLNGGWYFATREGEIGPFRSRAQAEKEVARFVLEKQQLAGFQTKRAGMVARMHKTTEVRNAHRDLDAKVDTGNLALRLDDNLLI